MASFYIHDGAQALTLRIVGPLTKGTAAELEQAWLTARSTLAGRNLTVDLGDVETIDAEGRSLLRQLAGQGARFITASRLTDAMAQEVSRRTPELLPKRRHGLWTRLTCCLRASLTPAVPCGPSVRKIW